MQELKSLSIATVLFVLLTVASAAILSPVVFVLWNIAPMNTGHQMSFLDALCVGGFLSIFGQWINKE